MNILAIGNSFSEDATRYLHKIAKSDNVDLTVVNLYIGGCPLSLHFRNIMGDKKAYGLQFNGQKTGFNMSVEEALLSRDWDYITIQQVSHQSPYFETYTPYIETICEYIRELAPKAKLLIHQTWAYEKNSDRLCKELGYNTHQEMFKDIENAYKKAANTVNADGIIPSGKMFELLLENGIEQIHRDTFHAKYGSGRYALGLLWYKHLTGNSVINNTFSDFDEEIPQNEIEIIKKVVESI